MNNALLAVTVISLQRLNNDMVAAANNSLTGFRKIGKGNLAYESMKKLSLIKEDGNPFDEETLLEGLSFVINERISAGTFV